MKLMVFSYSLTQRTSKIHVETRETRTYCKTSKTNALLQWMRTLGSILGHIKIHSTRRQSTKRKTSKHKRTSHQKKRFFKLMDPKGWDGSRPTHMRRLTLQQQEEHLLHDPKGAILKENENQQENIKNMHQNMGAKSRILKGDELKHMQKHSLH